MAPSFEGKFSDLPSDLVNECKKKEMLRECEKNPNKLINPVTKRKNIAFKDTAKGKNDSKRRRIGAGDCVEEQDEEIDQDSSYQDIIDEYKELTYSSEKKKKLNKKKF